MGEIQAMLVDGDREVSVFEPQALESAEAYIDFSDTLLSGLKPTEGAHIESQLDPVTVQAELSRILYGIDWRFVVMGVGKDLIVDDRPDDPDSDSAETFSAEMLQAASSAEVFAGQWDGRYRHVPVEGTDIPERFEGTGTATIRVPTYHRRLTLKLGFTAPEGSSFFDDLDLDYIIERDEQEQDRLASLHLATFRGGVYVNLFNRVISQRQEEQLLRLLRKVSGTENGAEPSYLEQRRVTDLTPDL